MKLRALHDYHSRLAHYPAGRVFEIDDAEGEWLMRDAPDAFERVYEPDAKLVSLLGRSTAETLAENGVSSVSALKALVARGDDAVLALDGVGPATLGDIKKALDGPPGDKMVRGSDVMQK
jgi:hypothetical protein